MVRKTKKESVLFVTLDMTNETTQRQAAMLVAALGSESVWTGDLSNMGTIIFVDGKTKQIISTEYQVDQETVLATLREAMALSR
jgi:KaiC/GvpD/RAD55 family RecA-like ATPase